MMINSFLATKKSSNVVLVHDPDSHLARYSLQPGLDSPWRDSNLKRENFN